MAGRWIMFAAVMAWRFAKAYPIVVIAVIALYLAGAGAVALADASGLGYGFYPLAAGAIIVAAVLIRANSRRRNARQAEAQSRRAAVHAAFMAPVDAYLDLASRWERAAVEPREVLEQIEAWRVARAANEHTFKGVWEDRMGREAAKAATTGKCGARDKRTDEVRAWNVEHGMGPNVPTQFDDILGQLEYVETPRSYQYTLEAGGAFGPS